MSGEPAEPGHADAGHGDAERPEPRRPGWRLIAGVTVPLALLLIWGGFVHWRQSSDARDTVHAADQFVPDLHVQSAQMSHEQAATVLPGQTLAFDSADSFARATGYVAERRVDIGSHVKKGDLLLRIAAPDLDQQREQAQAQLGQMQAALLEAQATMRQAQASAQLGAINKKRATTLAREGWGTRENADTQTTNASVSVTSVDSAQAGIAVAVANLHAQQATLDRLVALTGFERVTAPFDGVITQRDVDVGDLVQSDVNSGTPLFHIDQVDVLRCQVYVPQSQFASIHDGIEASVTVPELPGRVFKATVSRSSISLAQNSRSMLVEIDIDNADNALAPGLFVDVAFRNYADQPVVAIPDAALIFDAAGLHVAVVTPQNRVKMTAISISRDLGDVAELRDGLKGGESLVVNPPSDLQDGQKVHVVGGGSEPGSDTKSKT